MAAAWRGAALLALWLVVAGGVGGVADLGMGVAAAALAAWASLRLAPPGPGPGLGVRPRALAGLLLRLPFQAARAGFDVALVALDPRRPLRPGVVSFAPALPPGGPRDAFLTLSSLLPGTLPAGPRPDGTVAIHALDTGQPVAEAMAREEARFRAILAGDGARHG